MSDFSAQGAPQDSQPTPQSAQGEPAPIAENVPAKDPEAEKRHSLFIKIHDDIIERGRNNLDLVNFAYFLYRFNYVHQTKDDGWIGIQQNVNFCNTSVIKSTNNTMNHSRLEQMYIKDMFTNVYHTFWFKKDPYISAFNWNCKKCKEECSVSYEFCPYAFATAIIQCGEELNVKPEQIFSNILGDYKINFTFANYSAVIEGIDPEDIKGINSKSAHAAYFLLTTKAISIKGITNGIAEYTYMPLCRADDRKTFINRYIDFWKTGSGIYCQIDLNDKTNLFNSKRDGCRRCNFEQCPDKLAAYFVYLANKYNCNVLDLAYNIAKRNTYAGISTAENFQFSRYINNIQKSSMKESDKAEFIKLIHYIVAKKKNWIIPFLPFNLVFYTSDRSIAVETIKEFLNALWYFDYYGCGKDNTSSKHIYLSATSFSELLKEYTNAPKGLSFCLYDVELLCENKDFKAGYHKLLKVMEDKKNSNLTMICGEKTSVSRFFADFPEFKKKIFTRELEILDLSNGSVMDRLEEKLAATFVISEDVRNRLEKYIDIVYPSSALRSMEFVNDLYEKIIFNHFNYDVTAGNILAADDLPYVKPPRSESEIFNEFNKLTGLNKVKSQLRDVNDLVKFNIKTGRNSKNRINLHMMFTGNAGTGKTTVARLTAEILHSIGFIQENKLVICSGKDLIGEYLGQTAPKTAKKCEEAYNGVLFIDEAYQLNPYTSNRADHYREECIAELIQQMENNRDRLVVIFAGYTDEMRDFLNRANTGLKSRIGREINFPDYSSDELLEIFRKIAADAGMTLEEGSEDKIYQIFEKAREDATHFGNARYARSLFERSLMQHAAITANLEENDPDLFILKTDEITMPSE